MFTRNDPPPPPIVQIFFFSHFNTTIFKALRVKQYCIKYVEPSNLLGKFFQFSLCILVSSSWPLPGRLGLEVYSESSLIWNHDGKYLGKDRAVSFGAISHTFLLAKIIESQGIRSVFQ